MRIEKHHLYNNLLRPVKTGVDWSISKNHNHKKKRFFFYLCFELNWIEEIDSRFSPYEIAPPKKWLRTWAKSKFSCIFFCFHSLIFCKKQRNKKKKRIFFFNLQFISFGSELKRRMRAERLAKEKAEKEAKKVSLKHKFYLFFFFFEWNCFFGLVALPFIHLVLLDSLQFCKNKFRKKAEVVKSTEKKENKEDKEELDPTVSHKTQFSEFPHSKAHCLNTGLFRQPFEWYCTIRKAKC